MFSDDDDDFLDSSLNDDLERFEAHLKGDAIGFMDSDRLEQIIDHFLINGQYNKSKECCELAISQFSYNPIFYLRKAQSVSAMGQLKEALHILTFIEKWAPVSCEFMLTKASIFSQLKDAKNAIRFFKEALSLSEPEDRDEIFLDLAMEYENLGDYKNAVKVLRDAIAFNTNNEGAIYEIAFCYDQLGEYEQAIKCYSDFIDENPYSFTAWYNLGNAYSKLENYEKAIWAYEYCIVINEDFGPVYFNLGSAYLSIEKYIEAVDCFHKCIDLDGEDAMALCYLGEAYEQMNELSQAKNNYLKSLELAPMLPDAWLGLGIVLDLEGKTNEALTFLLKAAKLDPENAGIYHVLAGAYEKIGENDLAEEYYQLSLALDGTDEECLTNYIELLSEGSVIDAYYYLTEFNEKIGNNQIGKVLEVNLLWKLGRFNESIALFKICFESDPSKAMELFEINPSLLNVQEFVTLTD
jgi:tetratricopeptide (TPR) repeat protein